MKAPADGWDREEREAVDELRGELEILQARHQHDPGIDLLRAGHHDALPPDLHSSVAHRLEHDPWARALVEGLDAADPVLEKGDRDRLLARIQRDARRGEPSATRWVWLKPGVATAVLVLGAATAWMAYRNSSSPSQAPRVEPQTTIVSTPAPPVFQLPLDTPKVTLSLAALTWRGGGADSPFLKDLKLPLDAVREGDYARADREFAALESRYPDAVEVFFYGGVSRLFVNDPQRATTALARASELADATFAPRTAWYLAIAEQRSGHSARARARLEELCRGTSDRAAPACAAVKQIDSASAASHAR